ncbi:efflux RND transporter permease subunit [Stenotrophobium rhamnosiphilum]|uniref:RND transporter n=1 Tax=Stenotrophobium rhamnosiphilum TaxID=2029166 RepID=A0A2T5MJZ0_9GAMM|nr:MMPL family transporter [Stenotrophobium rhamnosiphilum]PTU32897.1 RND transporter [Stenotrophobium rhamnosiphilum]
MLSLRFRIAAWVMAHRKFTWAVFTLITLGFAAGIPQVQLKTIFSDLLPKDDPYVKVYKDHPNFGNPLTVTIVVKRKNGDIYNAETLNKVWNLTRDIDLSPGVDHDQILSIATEKARYAEATPFGIDVRPLMEDHVPATAEEIQEFKGRVDKSPGARTFLISNDATATLINATFIESRLDYGVAFKYVHDLVKKAHDKDHDIYLAGQPVLTGWVYQYNSQTNWIFAVTLGMLVLALVLYMRNVVGVVTPIFTSAVAAIWGFGFVGWLKSPIEPLLMIVPLLLVARTFSHCVQFTERYYEIYWHVKDRVKAAEITMGVMMAPSVLGIFTDIVGIFLIAVAPIPAMERFALFCGFWCIWLIPTGVVLISLQLAALPAPRNVADLIGHGKVTKFQTGFQGLLRFLASLSFGKRARVTTIFMAVIAVVAVITALQIRIGNPVEGSNLLWDDSEFNESVRQINRLFPGVNTLEIVFEGKDQKNPRRLMQQADTIMTMQKIQALIERGDHPPRATLSFGDYLMEGNRLFSGGDTRWMPLDPTNMAVNAAVASVLMGSSPKAYSNVIDFELQNGTVSLWYKDNKQDTVDSALEQAKKAIAVVGADHKDFLIRLGTGTIALQQAMNDVVHRFHWVIIGLLNIVILIGCSLAYRSIVAGLILLIPVNMANFILNASMHMIGIGLDINSLLVAAIGVGVGIDYGIYLLSRICEEYHAHDHDWGRTITASLTTTGKAIMFTASIMFVGILPWYFLSGLKFMADMGLLLVLTMLINMILALVALPLLVYLVKPKFVARKDLLVGEGVDLSQFTSADSDMQSGKSV